MRVVFAGTPDVALPSLDAVAASSHEVVAVLTRPDAARGRSKSLVPSPVALRAQQLGLPILRPEHPRDPDFQDALRALAPDCVPVVAYGALLPPSALAIPALGWVNLHFSLLPAWRGAAPVQRALMAGAKTTGSTTFLIDEGLDSGPVYRTLSTPIDADETAGDLLTRLAALGARQLVETLDAVAAGVEPDPQPEHGVTLAPKVTVADARLDWTASAAQLHDHVRGCSPQPGAWTTLSGERFKILRTRLADSTDLAPGHVAASKRSVVVGTGAGTLELVTVQPVGKRPMDAVAWARGLHGADLWLA
jgi:methionyl-tRNA formyltransferase